MKNFSEINIIPETEQAIDIACSKTGLSNEIVKKIFESQKLDGKTNTEISKYFENITSEKLPITSKNFIEETSNVLSELTFSNKNESTKKFLSVLNEFDNEGKIDSASMVDIVNTILIVNDEKAKKKLIPLLELPLENLISLNESLNSFQLIDDENASNVLLFEGLKEILNKNNSRWGISYHIQNSYNAIMGYIENEIKEIQLNSKMYSVSNDYHLAIINDMMSGNCSPINKHVSSVKTLVPDLQTLIFDMVLIVNRYIESDESTLQFVSRQTYNDYNESANMFLKSIISSIKNSKIISSEDIINYLKPVENTGEENFDYLSNDMILKQISRMIDRNKLKYDMWNLSKRGIVDMTNFIKSSSDQFNLKIRPIMRTYITKSFELINSIEKSEILLSNSKRY